MAASASFCVYGSSLSALTLSKIRGQSESRRVLDLSRKIDVPSLVSFALAVSDQAILSFKPFRAFDAVELAQAWQILCRF